MKKFLRKFIHNKRALTPVLSELLLTVIAVAAMSVAASATYVITTNMRSSMSERVIVEDVWFQTAANRVTVYVCNVGTVDVSISNVYINHILYRVSITLKAASNVTSFTIQYSGLNLGDQAYIDIVTARGLHIADYYKVT
jgi:hypothetical protein